MDRSVAFVFTRGSLYKNHHPVDFRNDPFASRSLLTTGDSFSGLGLGWRVGKTEGGLLLVQCPIVTGVFNFPSSRSKRRLIGGFEVRRHELSDRSRFGFEIVIEPFEDRGEVKRAFFYIHPVFRFRAQEEAALFLQLDV